MKQTQVVMNRKKINELMERMKNQKAELEADRISLNMSKAQYTMFRKMYLELKRKSDEVIDCDTPHLRLKNLYLKQFQPFEKEYPDCNIYEINELKKRSEILKWASVDLITSLIKETVTDSDMFRNAEVGVDPIELA